MSLFDLFRRKKPTPAPPTPVETRRTLAPSFACLSSENNPFNDVRWDVALTLAHVSKIVYLEPSEQEPQLVAIGARRPVQPIVRHDSEAVVASDDKAIVVGFRGTSSLRDFLTDGRFFQHLTPEGTYHRGFFQAADVIYEQSVRELQRQHVESKRLWITGHSLGGALAMLFAARLVRETKLDPAGIVTFGQPLVMSTELCQGILKRFGANYVRFVNNWDIVTRMPPIYRHTGARVHLADDYALREPSVAYSASADAPGGSPLRHDFDEDDQQLAPMSLEEYREFLEEHSAPDEQQPGRRRHRRREAASSAPTAWYDPFTPHYMDSYIPRIEEPGRKNFR